MLTAVEPVPAPVWKTSLDFQSLTFYVVVFYFGSTTIYFSIHRVQPCLDWFKP